jgi:hypothetical protein
MMTSDYIAEHERIVKDFIEKMKSKDDEIKSLKDNIDNAISYLEKCDVGFARLNTSYLTSLLTKKNVGMQNNKQSKSDDDFGVHNCLNCDIDQTCKLSHGYSCACHGRKWVPKKITELHFLPDPKCEICKGTGEMPAQPGIHSDPPERCHCVVFGDMLGRAR